MTHIAAEFSIFLFFFSRDCAVDRKSDIWSQPELSIRDADEKDRSPGNENEGAIVNYHTYVRFWRRTFHEPNLIRINSN